MVTTTTRDVTNFQDFKLFKSIGPLIKAYRKFHTLSQEKLAARIRISVRQLQRWETDQRRILIENLHDLSEVTGIPMHVCVALNADQPIWYSLEQRRFAYSAMEAQFLFHELFRFHEQTNDGTLFRYDRISTDRHMSLILACHGEMYGAGTSLKKETFREACRLLPDLNRIVFDSWGHYVGHNVCLPITLAAYQQLKKHMILEDYLTRDRMSDILALNEGCFFHYSSFGTSLNIVHQLYINLTRHLIRIEPKEKYLIAVNTALIEAEEFFNHLGLRIVSDYEEVHDTILPRMYEIELDVLMRPLGPCGWMLEERNSQADSGNPENRREINDSGYDAENRDNQDNEIIVDDSKLIVDETQKRQPAGRKNELSCPNPECISYGLTGHGNVISNGTYRTKGGGRSCRFLCRDCRKSFCSRTGTLFYDLRTQEDRVLRALNLLVTGVPLRNIAKSLEVNHNTLLHWLEIAAEKKAETEDLLIKKLDVSQAELDSLWKFIKDGSHLRGNKTL